MKHEIYRITSVSIVGQHALHLEFNDGTSQNIDFKSVLAGELYEPLRDPEVFRQVRLDPEVHTVVWPNGADFDPATLHDWHVLEDEWKAQTKRLDRVAEEHASYGENAAGGGGKA